ncbi:MAG: class 1 fructose-bisphosphatase [Nitrospinota bacterium]
MAAIGKTLNRHILEEQKRFPELSGQLSALLSQIAFAAKILSREINRAALVGRLGLVGEKNPTGDAQKKLDVFSNEVVVEAFADTQLVASIASEELEEVKCIECQTGAEYVLCIDPLDGSSNTDVNAAVGTIFGIYRRKEGVHHDPEEDFRRKGSEQAAAGYIMYGTSTVLVYTVGYGVHGFTLDHDLGEFLLSHEDLRCPSRGRTFSANVTRSQEWHPNIQRLIDHLTDRDPETNRPYTLRYTGALVSDLHRSLIEGGIYFYPADPGNRDGKLRLLYECAPLAFVVERAGGRASTGAQPIGDIRVESIHQRVPLVIGSADDVTLYEKFLRDGNP